MIYVCLKCKDYFEAKKAERCTNCNSSAFILLDAPEPIPSPDDDFIDIS